MEDVKYEQVWKCKTCGEVVKFPKEAWNSWSKEQRESFTTELERQHLVHPGD